MAGRSFLILGGIGLTAGALAHVLAVIGGPDWIAFLGAPPSIVASARDGTWLAPVVTLGIAAILLVWAAYAFSGAGWLRRLPFLRWMLGIVAGIFILRGLLVVPMIAQANPAAAFDLFHVAASAYVLVLGILLALGVRGLLRAA